MQNKNYPYLGLTRCLACTANADCTIRISSTGSLITILTNFGGDIRHFVPGSPADQILPGMRPRHPRRRWRLWRKHVLDGGAHWRHLVNTIEPSMCGSDPTFLSNYFNHLFDIALKLQGGVVAQRVGGRTCDQQIAGSTLGRGAAA